MTTIKHSSPPPEGSVESDILTRHQLSSPEASTFTGGNLLVASSKIKIPAKVMSLKPFQCCKTEALTHWKPTSQLH